MGQLIMISYDSINISIWKNQRMIIRSNTCHAEWLKDHDERDGAIFLFKDKEFHTGLHFPRGPGYIRLDFTVGP